MKAYLLPIIILLSLSSCSAFKDGHAPQAGSNHDPVEVVPKTLDEAHLELERLLPKRVIAKIDAMKKEDEMIDYHMDWNVDAQ